LVGMRFFISQAQGYPKPHA